MSEQHQLDLNQPILNLTQQYEDLYDFLIANGFDQLKNPMVLKTFGRTMTLEKALKLKHIDVEAFKHRLMEHLFADQITSDERLFKDQMTESFDIDIQGVLPCPIHMPLRDAITEATQSIAAQSNLNLHIDLRSANLGVSWLTHMPDILMSAGFDLFFSHEMKQTYLDTDIYSGGNYPIHPSFKEHGVDLKDPRGCYHIIGMVPAIFVINKRELNGRAIPNSWSDLFKPEYAASVAIPHGDLDLYNAVTLTLLAHYGEEALRSFGRSIAVHLHPAQMTAHRSSNPLPLVSIAPLFFSQMIDDPELEVVWPADGAIVSPIYLLSKMDKPHVRDLSDQIVSPKIAEIFAHGGKFPSTSRDVNQDVEPDQKFLFIGWDYVYQNDVEALILHAKALVEAGFKDYQTSLEI